MTKSSKASAVIAISLAFLTLALYLPELWALWNPTGWLGLDVNYDGVVKSVDQRSPAWSAGIRAGDRIDYSHTPLSDQFVLPYSIHAPPGGQRVTVDLVRPDASGPRQVSMIAASIRYDATETIELLLRVFLALVFVAVGLATVLLKSMRTTWGFFLYCIGNVGHAGVLYTWLGPYWIALLIYANLTQAAAFAGFMIFAARCPDDRADGLRKWLDWAALPVFVLLAAVAIFGDISHSVFGAMAEKWQQIWVLASVIAYVCGALALIAKYVTGSADERQRIQLIAIGFAVGFGAIQLIHVSQDAGWFPLHAPHWVFESLPLLNVFAPVAVAYAILKHRMFDIRFFVRRGFVFGAVSATVVTLVAVGGHEVDAIGANGASVPIQLIAVIVGAWLKQIGSGVDAILNRLFYRQRLKAEERLDLAAKALPSSSSEKQLGELLVRTPLEEYHLTSGAAFTRHADGRFVRIVDLNWDAADVRVLDPDSSFLAILQSSARPMAVDEDDWHEGKLPSGAAQPRIAIPVMLRDKLVGVALYGAHDTQLDLDPDEVKTLSALAAGAAAAFDNLRAMELEAQVRVLSAAPATPNGA